MPVCRLIVDEPLDGPTNMAADDAILETAESCGLSTLRIYQWVEPTLSLGYFQSITERLSHGPSRSCPVVRRKSGGGAILHHHDITYALALASSPSNTLEGRVVHSPATGKGTAPTEAFPAPARLSEWLYDQVHGAWIHALFGCQPSPRRFGPECPAERPPKPFLCFQRRNCWDLVVGDQKILGSAQRKGRRAILQHGSLLLAQSEQAPELAGLAEICSCCPSKKEIIDRFLEELGSRLSLEYQRSNWEAARNSEITFRDQQRESLYANSAWTSRR
jgi:lipoyl(octanoyl) transferase